MDFITNVFTTHKDILMSPITLCIVIAVLGVIGYFLLVRESSTLSQKEIVQERIVSVPENDHIMEHGDHPITEEGNAPEMDSHEEAIAYDSTESQHVDA